MKKSIFSILMFLLLSFLLVFLFYENKEAIKQKPTKEMGEKLFHENFDLVNDAAELIWEHYDEFDNLVIEGESKLHLFCNGWTKDYYPYSETSLTKKEKDKIFEAWNTLAANACDVTYYISHPTMAPIIAIHCGFDEDNNTFSYFYIRPVATHDKNIVPEETVKKSITGNNFNNPISYLQWLPIDNTYWYQGTRND